MTNAEIKEALLNERPVIARTPNALDCDMEFARVSKIMSMSLRWRMAYIIKE